MLSQIIQSASRHVALSLLGIILVLRAVLKRKLILLVLAGTCIAGIPLGYIFITHH